jgi:hypothetical protein
MRFMRVSFEDIGPESEAARVLMHPGPLAEKIVERSQLAGTAGLAPALATHREPVDANSVAPAPMKADRIR